MHLCDIKNNQTTTCFDPRGLVIRESSNLVNKAKLVHDFLSLYVSFLHMFRATMCPLSGEITVSMRHLVFVNVWMTVWYAPCIPVIYT
jgi:hypothetical protein